MIVRVILAERRNDGSNGFGIIPRQTFQLHRFACFGGRFPVQNLKGCHAFGLYWNGPHEAIWGCTKTWYHFTVNVPKSCCRFFTLIIFWAVNTLEVLQRQAKPKWKARSYYTIPSADTLASSIHIMRNQDVQCTVFQISLICNLPNHKFYQRFLSSIGGDAHRTWPFRRQQCEFDTHVEAAGTLCTTQHINDMRSSHFQERQASSLYVWLLSSVNPAPPWVPKYSKIIMRDRKSVV